MIIGDFLLNLAASLAYSLLEHAYHTHFTDPQRAALERVYARGFAKLLTSPRRPLSHDETSHLSDVLTNFIAQTGTADAYLALALHNDAPDLDQLTRAFQTFGGPTKVRGLAFDFDRGLLALYEGLTTALTTEAGQPDSPLANLVTVNQNRAILRALTQLHDLPLAPNAPAPTQPTTAAAPAPIPPAPTYHTCFISYAHQNQTFVDRLYTDLRQAGVPCWYAPEDMPIGARIRQTIDQAIQGQAKLLLVLSRHSVASPWVEKEVETAFETEQQRKNAGRSD